MTAPVDLPERVRRKALALGSSGLRWLDTLADGIADLEKQWAIQVGSAITGGSGGYVAHATTADGSSAVLKMAIPDGLAGHGDFPSELRAAQFGQGRGYVRLLRSDERRRVMLQERLGRPLAELGLSIESQIEIIATTLTRGWQRAERPTRWRTGAEQAQHLLDSIQADWIALGQPCSERTILRAQRCATARRDAFDHVGSVVIHGDAHPWNLLEVPNEPELSGGFKLIDPHGMISEPAHDLAMPLRGWNDELLQGDAAEEVSAWCSHLHDRTGAAPRAIWDWAFAERVSTGLFLLRLGDTEGNRFLSVAERLTEQ